MTSVVSPIKLIEEIPVAKQVYLAIDAARKRPEVYISILESYKSSFLEPEEINDTNSKKRKNQSTKTNSIKKYVLENQKVILADQGMEAVEEAIEYLSAVDPSKLPSMSFSDGLSSAARDLAVFAGVTGSITDCDGDGAGMDKRAERYGEWIDCIGENVYYGNHPSNTGTSIVMDWIIDNGIENKGHRNNIFSEKFTTVGVHYGVHKKHGFVCVATFAGGFNKKEPTNKPRVRFEEDLTGRASYNENFNIFSPMPSIKEIMYSQDKIIDIASPVSTKEILDKVSKTTSSPGPGVTQVARTFFTSSTPRKGNTTTVNTDLVKRYNETGIPLVDSKKRRFTIRKDPVPGMQKLVTTSLITGGKEKVLDVKLEPVYTQDKELVQSMGKSASQGGWLKKDFWL